jgi:hypothetical protein
MDDLQPTGIAKGDLLQRRQASFVTLDCNYAFCSGCQKRPRKAAGTGTNLDHIHASERSCFAGDPISQVQVKEEILAERLLCREPVLRNDVTQRRQVVDLSPAWIVHGVLDADASEFASLRA